MGNHNSLCQVYLDLYERLHSDVAGATASVRQAEYCKDIETIRRRCSSEGLSFFTKTLPRLGKAVDKALATGGILQFSSFSKKKGTQLPAFCWWLFSMIFDLTGRERSDASPLALKRLRQLLYVYYKLEIPYDEATTTKVIADFVETDERLVFEPANLDGFTSIVASRAKTLVRRVMSELCLRDIIPRHGPGTVATGEKCWEKRAFKRIYSTAERVYPFTDYFFYNFTHVADRLDDIRGATELPASTAKVVLVPKDSRGPRLISCEPLEIQWLQQGQMRKIVPHLESHRLTRGLVNFTNQSVNRALALKASLDGSLSTLDMKEASDRVSWKLVDYLFPEHVSEALYATRSGFTKLPDGRIVQLNKFAPMGSAVCFPVEALVFWALCASIVSCTRNIPLVEASRTIYVYGDDIICRSEDQAAIRQHLPSFDLMVNEDKCCVGKTFKESCGCDAYRGVDVTPTKFRRTWCQSLDCETYQSWVEYSNSLAANGYFGSAEYIESLIQKIRKTPYFNMADHDGIGFVRAHVIAQRKNREIGSRMRFNKDTHVLQVLCWSSKASNKKTPDGGWAEMLRVFSYKDHSPVEGYPARISSPPSVEAHVYAVRRRNRLQRRWANLI